MRWIWNRKGEKRPELDPQEARQARFGKPVLIVLIVSLTGAMIALAIAGGIIG